MEQPKERKVATPVSYPLYQLKLSCHIIPESWDVWPPLSARADSISVTTSSQNLRKSGAPLSARPDSIINTVWPPLSAGANSIYVATPSQNLGTSGHIYQLDLYSISVSTPSQNLRMSSYLYQLEPTVFCHCPATSISQS
jgi:hypothetical protein